MIWESEISSHIKNVLVNQWNAQSNIDNPSRSAILMNSPIEDAKLRESEIIWEEMINFPGFNKKSKSLINLIKLLGFFFFFLYLLYINF